MIFRAVNRAPFIFLENRPFIILKPLETSSLTSMASFSMETAYVIESKLVNLNGFVWLRFFASLAATNRE